MDVLPFWVNPKPTPIVSANGDVLGERLPNRFEIGDDESLVIKPDIISLSDTKDAISFASKMALCDNLPSVSTSSEHLDVLGVCEKTNELSENLF